MRNRPIPRSAARESHCFTRKLSVAIFIGGCALCIAGCGGAPSVTIAGAYFPGWLLCAIFAVIVAIISRAVMVATGIADHVPYQLAVCLSVGVIAAVVLWRLWAVH